ncbi:hypothetical protein PTTG_29847 [Puccinia triticina 1-1 BBBD Race 1]|uniref:Uncharacterized protein n=2 Tax=Puccinia triticina TaxID=208348 RepID=A0A180G283_PUCT1|nr:uncharacterized protein PtA15_5A154 [Puccinia triticina]OAV86539.1 hypothetical protein PTTG_29847 [Puccinia triticina 1-1 BBBD Race 1]WAQ84583.1 hypothetical protein PtA15_5A154 [Puccinia triticina]WAR57926.1 hypothetical protein PtB15_5B156 [Puccinia triticina]
MHLVHLSVFISVAVLLAAHRVEGLDESEIIPTGNQLIQVNENPESAPHSHEKRTLEKRRKKKKGGKGGKKNKF